MWIVSPTSACSLFVYFSIFTLLATGRVSELVEEMNQHDGNTESREQPVDDKLIEFSGDERELKEAFNRDVGNVRLVLIVSPT